MNALKNRKPLFVAGFAALSLLLIVLLLELTGFILIGLHFQGIRSRADLKGSLDTPGILKTQETLERTETDLPSWVQTDMLHPYTGFVRNPALPRQVFNNRVIRIPVNEYGFFGDPPPKKQEAGSVTVALTGGSVALELFLYGGDVLKPELARLPRFQGKNIHLICLALGGFKQPQQLMALSYFLALGFHFDMIINCDGFNEAALPFSQNVPYHTHPAFPRAWSLYAKKSLDTEVALLFGKIYESRQRLEKWRGRMSGPLCRRSSFCLLLWHRIKSREEKQQIALDLEIRENLKVKVPINPQETGPSYTVFSEETLFADCAELWKRSSLQMWRLCTANKIEYIHCLQPNQYVPDSKVLSDWERRNIYAGPENLARHAVEKGYPDMIASGKELAAQGLPFTDLTQLFKPYSETLYRDNSCHYNDRGYQILAEKLVQIVRALKTK